MTVSAPPEPAVSVILRLRRPADRAMASLQSILRQTLQDWELVLVGPGAEQLPEGLRRDGRIRHLLKDPTFADGAASLNRAVTSTRGPLVAFLDSDDVASGKRLAVQRGFLQSNPEYGLVAAGIEYLGFGRRATRRVVVQASPDGLLALLLRRNVIPFGTVMVRRECFERAGGFDESLAHGVEHDLWLRMALEYRLVVLPEALCSRFGDAGLWNGMLDSCSDDRRRHHAGHILHRHPRGARILEDAVSRCPDDDLLWECFVSRPSEPARRPAEPGDGQESGRGAALRLGGIESRADVSALGAAPSPTGLGADPNLSALCMGCLRYGSGSPTPFNDLGRYYARRNPLLAYLCLLRALSIDPHQGSVLTRALSAWSDGVSAPRVSAGDDPGPTRAVPTAGRGSAAGACAVSVLMPTYNGAQRIRESIQSVLSQTLQDVELIVVDDGSVDATEEAVRSVPAPQVRYIRTEHRGLAAALNTGARYARGRYIAYLDDDDVYYPEHLARLVSILDRSNAAMVYSKSRLVYGRLEHGMFRPAVDMGTYSDDYDYDNLHHRCIISTLNVVHRRNCLTILGGFDERLPRCMDWDLWVRLSERFPIVHLDEFTGEYRHHEGNMSARDFPEKRVLADLLENYFTSCRGQAILCWAAHLQGRMEESEAVRRAMESAPFAFRDDVYRNLLDILPGVRRGSRLIERLFFHRRRWYLKYLLSLARRRRWKEFRYIPPAILPSLLWSAAATGWLFATRRWRGR